MSIRTYTMRANSSKHCQKNDHNNIIGRVRTKYNEFFYSFVYKCDIAIRNCDYCTLRASRDTTKYYKNELGRDYSVNNFMTDGKTVILIFTSKFKNNLNTIKLYRIGCN